MARPRKNPEDPKWQSVKEEVESKPDDWKMYFCAAFSGLIARGGLSHEQIIKTAKQYADEAIKQL